MGIDSIAHKAVFLDRDGVLNRALVRQGILTPPRRLDEVEILPGVPQALHRLHRAGMRLIVVTNQPDVARGSLSRETVEQLHARLRSELPLDDIRVCYHDDHDKCDCRKPKPGMLLAAARDFGLDLAASYMVGDTWRDVQAGRQAGCKVALIEQGYHPEGDVQPHTRVSSLAEAAEWILHSEHLEGA